MSENRIDVVAVLDADIADHEGRILRGELPLSAYDSVNAKRQARDALVELIGAANDMANATGGDRCRAPMPTRRPRPRHS